MVRTRVGYTGGSTGWPTYHELADHTEAIQVTYDPEVVSYGALLDVFWDSHLPVFEPFSRQYRSAIFVLDDEQRAIAEQSLAERRQAVGKPLYTAIEQAKVFWKAEDYHQKYRLRADQVLMDAMVARFPDGSWVDSTAAARLNGLLGGYGYRGSLDALGLPASARRRLERFERDRAARH